MSCENYSVILIFARSRSVKNNLDVARPFLLTVRQRNNHEYLLPYAGVSNSFSASGHIYVHGF